MIQFYTYAIVFLHILMFNTVKFHDAEIIAVSARPGGPDSDAQPEGLNELVETIKKQVQLYFFLLGN